MRRLLMVWIISSACTPINVSDNRVMSDGKPNGSTPQAGASADAQSIPARPDKPSPSNPNPALANFLPVAYTDELEPSMTLLCTAACHSGAPAPGAALLNSADALKAAHGAASAAIDGGSMPPNVSTLSANDQKLLAQLSLSLKSWSKNEAYANALSDYKITYVPAVSAISTALCLSCHQGDQASGGLRLETQEQWKTAMPAILQAIESGRMPPRIDAIQGPRLIKFLNAWQNQNFP